MSYDQNREASSPSDVERENNRAASGQTDEENSNPAGNINNFISVPPGYTGDPNDKGVLIFDATFESGNLGRVDSINEFEYDLFIRPDTCNERYRVWYYFTVRNVKQDQRVIFNIVNFSKTKSLYRDGMSPVVRSTSRPWWIRLPEKHVYYYRSPQHRNNYVMSFVFCFDREDDVYAFAYCYPYTYTRLQKYLESLESRHHPCFHRELLCQSIQRRRVDLLTLTSPKNLENNKRQRIVFITARTHPGETPASFVCQGFLDFLLSDHPISKALLDQIVFKIVPMINPDGVYIGNYRCSLLGFDLNRHWIEPSRWGQPTVFECKALILQIYRDSSKLLDFFVDIHAHSTMMNGFMYGNLFEDQTRYEKQSLFPRLFAQNATDFSFSNTNFNRDSVKAGTGRRALASIMDDNTLCYTLEVSFSSYHSATTNTSLPYTEEGYAKLGRNLARTFNDYYRAVQGAVPVPAPAPAPAPASASASVPATQPESGNGTGSLHANASSNSNSNSNSASASNSNANSSSKAKVIASQNDIEDSDNEEMDAPPPKPDHSFTARN